MEPKNLKERADTPKSLTLDYLTKTLEFLASLVERNGFLKSSQVMGSEESKEQSIEQESTATKKLISTLEVIELNPATKNTLLSALKCPTI